MDQTGTTNGKLGESSHVPVPTTVHVEKSLSTSSSNAKSARQNKPSTIQKVPSSSKVNAEEDVGNLESDADNTSPSTSSHGKESLRVEDLEILKTIGTGTFARVCLCRLRNANVNNNNTGKQQNIAEERNTSRNKYFALKILTMHDVIRLKQVEHIKNEKNILLDVQHPFIIDLVWHAKDSKTFLYMIFPYICGGELFSYLRSAGRFNASTSLFYSCEIVSALEYLHSLSIVYR